MSEHPLLEIGRRTVVAHRGSPTRAPENTIPSFELGFAEGGEVLEFDVRVTAEGVPVVLHDPTLDRTTDRTGAVSEYTLDALRDADAGARFTPDGGATFPWRDRGVRIPTLSEVLDAFSDRWLLVEVKVPEAGVPIRRLLEEHDMVGRCILASEHDAALDAFRQPPFRRGASMSEALSLWQRTASGSPPSRLEHVGLFIPERRGGQEIATSPLLGAARRLACPVHVWTVNDLAAAERLWRDGATGIVTDLAREMRELRDSLEDAL